MADDRRLVRTRLGVLTAILIAVDILVNGYRQHMAVMDVGLAVSGLYLGPVALVGYVVWGRRQTAGWEKEHGAAPERPFPATVAIGVTHCGSGCAIGDFVGGWLVLAFALQIAGLALVAEYAVDYSLAFAFGTRSSTSPSHRCAGSGSERRLGGGGQGRHRFADRIRGRDVRLDGGGPTGASSPTRT